MEVTLSTVKSVIETYLNAEVASTDENFFDQGILDSFEAMNLLIVLEEKFGARLEFRDFTDNENFKLNYFYERLRAAKV